MTKQKKSFMDTLTDPSLGFISPASIAKVDGAKEPEEEPIKAPEGYRVNPLYLERRSERLQLLIPPSLKEQLKATAKQQKTSVNNLVNELLQSALTKE